MSPHSKPTVVLYAFDTMADWEYAYAVAGLALAATHDPTGPVPALVVASASGAVVRTQGGLTVQPDAALGALDPATVEMVILPGGAAWQPGAGATLDGEHSAALSLARTILAAGGAVAGICAATRAMAEAGLLNEVPHTSNSPDFLATVDYPGLSRYIEAPAVGSGDIITAAGNAPVEFAREIFRRLQLFDEATLERWYEEFAGASPTPALMSQ